MINVIGWRKTFLGIAAAFVLAAIVAISVFGFEQGIEFRGGTLWRFTVEGALPDTSSIEEVVTSVLGTGELYVSYDEERGSVLLRLPEVSEEDHQALREGFVERHPSFEEQSFQSIGPSVGERLRNRSLIALVLVLVCISLYIAFAFRKVRRPVSSWKYGIITLLTLAHDVIIPAGMLAILGRFAGVQIDTALIVALLVVMGFSVHDTIVVFDRIRENLTASKGGDFGGVINSSLNQVLMRSLNTSFTLILVLVALLVVGPLQLRLFVLTLLVGIVSGVYSSIFVASPLLFVAERMGKKK